MFTVGDRIWVKTSVLEGAGTIDFINIDHEGKALYAVMMDDPDLRFKEQDEYRFWRANMLKRLEDVPQQRLVICYNVFHEQAE